MSNNPNLWWVYDNDNKSFSTLPTGPFLLPAIAVILIASAFKQLFIGAATAESVAGRLSRTKNWQTKYKRYQKLVSNAVKNNGDISVAERYELDQLKAYLNNPHGN
jgi:hypothetical protein